MKFIVGSVLILSLIACSTTTKTPTTLEGVPRVPINKTIPTVDVPNTQTSPKEQ